jgi:hypothetical protein
VDFIFILWYAFIPEETNMKKLKTAVRVKPVQATEIKDKKIAMQIIKDIQKPIPASVYERHEKFAKAIDGIIRR